MDDGTDADDSGATDGWGYEDDMSGIVPAAAADAGMLCSE